MPRPAIALRILRLSAYAAAGVFLLASVLLIVARLWLPSIVERKADIETLLSEKAGRRIVIGSLATFWDGIHPGVQIGDLRIHAKGEGASAILTFPEVRVSLAWPALLRGDFALHELVIARAALALERLPDGRIRLADFSEPAGGNGTEWRDWLLRQRKVVIEDARLRWTDHQAAEGPLTFEQVNVSVRNSGTRHRFAASARFPKGRCEECRVQLDLRGDPSAPQAAEGSAYVETKGLDLARLPLIVAEHFPAQAKGVVDAQIRARWSAGRLRALEGKFNASRLGVPIDDQRALAVAAVGGDFAWVGEREGWQLDVNDLAVKVNGQPWHTGRLRVQHDRKQTRAFVERADLGDLSAIATRLGVGRRLTRLSPGGEARQVKLRLDGPWRAPVDFSLEAQLSNARIAAQGKIPGVQGLSGRAMVAKDGGELLLDARKLRLDMAAAFRAPVDFDQAKARVNWKREAQQWRVVVRNLGLATYGGNITGQAEATVPVDGKAPPHLRFQAQASGISAPDARRFYPVKRWPLPLFNWLDGAIGGGEVTRAQVRYDGRVDRFPFTAGDGVFEVTGRVRNGRLRYLPGWVPVERVDAQVSIKGSEVRVTGKGKIRALDATGVEVHVPDWRQRDAGIAIAAKVSGPINDALGVLQSAEGRRWTGSLAEGVQGRGSGVLDLRIRAPLRRHQHGFSLEGEYRFVDAHILSPLPGLDLEHLQGALAFNQSGLIGGQLTGRFLGAETALVVKSQGPNQARMTAHGAITDNALQALLGSRVTASIKGTAPWIATVDFAPDSTRLSVESDLRGLTVALPPPLNKRAGEPMTLKIDTAMSDGRAHALDLALGELINGQLRFEKQAGLWAFASGRVHVGAQAAAPTAGRGLHLSVSLPALDLDPWLHLFRAHESSSFAASVPAMLTRVSAKVDQLTAFKRPFGAVTLDLAQQRKAWAGTVIGDAMSGRVRFERGQRVGTVRLDLDRLYWPRGRGHAGEPAWRGAPIDPRRLPIVHVKSRSVQYGEAALGALDFLATPGDEGWRVQHLLLSRRDMNLIVRGLWAHGENAQSTQLDAEFTSGDLESLLHALGLPDQIAEGKAHIKGALAWPGAPMDLKLATLDGKLHIKAQNGRFVKVKQGAGKLLGLLDIGSLVRYLSLDLSTFFGKGYTFNRIEGELLLKQGSATTPGLAIRGPSADMDVIGRAGLVTEDFDLEVRVVPQLRDGLAVAGGIFGGPVVGAAILLLERIFKKQIREGTRVTYIVKGPWREPQVKRLVAEAETSE